MIALLDVRAAACCALLAAPSASAEDWTQWRGEDRVGVWSETGIVEELPETLKVKWRVPLNTGYSGPAVADGRVFITDWGEDPESRTVDGTERAIALDEETGEMLWVTEWPTTYRMLMFSYAVGPRATPSVDGDRVYVAGAAGALLCLSVETGDIIWQKDFIKDYDSRIPTFGITSAPIVDGDHLITAVGAEGGLVMAFDKRTGEEVWRSLEVTREIGYPQPIIIEAGGRRQLIVWHPAALVSLDPGTGEPYWEEEWEVGAGMSVATPVHSGNYLLVTQFYGGSLMMKLDQDRPSASRLWKGQSRSEMPGETDGLHAMITTPIMEDDHVYGVCSYGELRALEAATGERVWMSDEMVAQARWGTAFFVKHRDDRYFVNNDDGFLIIAQFTPEGYVERSRTKLIEPTSSAGFGPRRLFDRLVNWSHPAYANRHIFQRNDTEIIRASLDAADY